MTGRRHRIASIRARVARMRIASNSFGELLVRRTRRGVRITALTLPNENRTGKRTGATYAIVDLDEGGVNRLIARLVAIRGGKRALP